MDNIQSATVAIDTDAWPLKRQCETIGRFWALQWSAIQLTILRERGEKDLARFKYLILRRHQRSHFLQGVEKLGIDRSLPPAIVAGRYHFFSNAIGGLNMEYIEESDRKVWIRYMPPAWSFPGVSLFAVPASVQRAMFEGWHPFNGRSLGTRRLGFVVTKVYQEGCPYDEGYFYEYDRDLDDDEFIRFAPVTTSPDYRPDAIPVLDPKEWPEARLIKARRNFALGYVEDAVTTAIEMYGVKTASDFIGQAARMTALQFFGELKDSLGVATVDAAAFVSIFQVLSRLAGETFSVESNGPGDYLVKRSNRVLAAEPVDADIYRALFQYQDMAAKVLSPRVAVNLVSVDIKGGVAETWAVRDSATRLF